MALQWSYRQRAFPYVTAKFTVDLKTLFSPTTDLPPEEDSDRQLAVLVAKRNEIALLDSERNSRLNSGALEQSTVETTKGECL